MKVSISRILLLILFVLPAALPGQDNSSNRIQLGLQKLNTLGSILYVAAHPDDENTRLIAWMANEKHLRTAYLSLTRGDGGQNLVGTETGDLMGLLRTNELLEARKIDGGEQFFTRAVDYGYSKNPEEAFTKWDKQLVLADVVRTIRKFQPDVIITRFPPTSRAGHGHHTASAILAEEAFDLANDPTAFPEQLKTLQTWQPKRLFWNASSWWDKELPEKAAKNDSFASLDTGDYSVLLGKSYSEMASESRSQHKSQGFGSGKTRGEQMEYLQWIKGENPNGKIFSGIDHSWNRIEGGAKIGKLLDKLLADFDPLNPSASVDGLAKAHKMIAALPDGYWKTLKMAECEALILDCAGVWMESTADEYSAAYGEKIGLTASIVRRSKTAVKLLSVSYNGKDTTTSMDVPFNVLTELKTQITVPQTARTHPYWLEKPFEGMYSVADPEMIGKPLNPPSMKVNFTVEVAGIKMNVERPLVYKWTDRVEGELYRPFVAMPPVTANLGDKVYIFASNAAQEVKLSLRFHRDVEFGSVSLNLPSGWTSEPEQIAVTGGDRGTEMALLFQVTPPKTASSGEIAVNLLFDSREEARSLVEITHNHIETQTLLPRAEAKIVKLDVAIRGRNVAYIEGAGDEVPQSLKQLGYEVTVLDEKAIRSQDLSQYDAIIAGIRAFNTQEYLKFVNAKLLDYVKNGGTYIVQYNTNRGLVTEDIGPYPMTYSRDRVTVEEAKPTFLAPEHPLLNSPNKITEADFDGWIQERGLYFPSEWDEHYTALIGWNDPGEDMTKGSLLVADYGKGKFIYTGISFFRELPAGVAGAYKLFANLVSYGKDMP
jgi:LmbE family N-acetylglucosaminyl deacetylase